MMLCQRYGATWETLRSCGSLGLPFFFSRPSNLPRNASPKAFSFGAHVIKTISCVSGPSVPFQQQRLLPQRQPCMSSKFRGGSRCPGHCLRASVKHALPFRKQHTCFSQPRPRKVTKRCCLALNTCSLRSCAQACLGFRHPSLPCTGRGPDTDPQRCIWCLLG